MQIGVSFILVSSPPLTQCFIVFQHITKHYSSEIYILLRWIKQLRESNLNIFQRLWIIKLCVGVVGVWWMSDSIPILNKSWWVSDRNNSFHSFQLTTVKWNHYHYFWEQSKWEMKEWRIQHSHLKINLLIYILLIVKYTIHYCISKFDLNNFFCFFFMNLFFMSVI